MHRGMVFEHSVLLVGLFVVMLSRAFLITGQYFVSFGSNASTLVWFQTSKHGSLVWNPRWLAWDCCVACIWAKPSWSTLIIWVGRCRSSPCQQLKAKELLNLLWVPYSECDQMRHLTSFLCCGDFPRIPWCWSPISATKEESTSSHWSWNRSR